MTFTRGQFLACLASPLAGQSGEELERFSDYDSSFRVDVQASDPRLKCFDLRNLTTWQTPSDHFFTFHQTKTVEDLDLKSWRLAISGSVARPRVFTFADLAHHPVKEVPVTIECSGNNGRTQLMNGLVSNGVWSGVELAPLLRHCGMLAEAREVVFFGADVERERKWPAGDREFDVPHGRSIFIQDALESGAILATQLNGRPLSAEHGYPLRLIVPGWYGMTQIKWLSRIVVLDRRYEGRHMARNYHSMRVSSQQLVLETSIARNRLKSVVARVTRQISGGRLTHSVCGAAWGGPNLIEHVEIRIDDQPWQQAAIVDKGSKYAWSLWRAVWADASPGVHTVVSRAIDSRGQIQPPQSELISARENNSQWPRRIVLTG